MNSVLYDSELIFRNLKNQELIYNLYFTREGGEKINKININELAKHKNNRLVINYRINLLNLTILT